MKAQTSKDSPLTAPESYGPLGPPSCSDLTGASFQNVGEGSTSSRLLPDTRNVFLSAFWFPPIRDYSFPVNIAEADLKRARACFVGVGGGVQNLWSYIEERKGTKIMNERDNWGIIVIIVLSIVLALILLFMNGCAKFESTVTFYPDGSRIYRTTETGAIFLSRKGSFRVADEWLDSNNELHEFSTTRNVDENAQGQVEVFRYLFEAGKAAGSVGIAP